MILDFFFVRGHSRPQSNERNFSTGHDCHSRGQHHRHWRPLASLVVKYSPTSFKYSVYTGIQCPEVNTVKYSVFNVFKKATCGCRRGRGRGRGAVRARAWCGRGRKCRGRCVLAAGGRLTVGHVVCSRRAPVADATPHYHCTEGQQDGVVRRRDVMTAQARRQQSRHARGGADIRHVYIQLQLSNTLYIQNTVP